MLNEPVKLSHCGVIVKENDTMMVIHSVSKEVSGTDGVQQISFRKFLGDCLKGHLYVVRLRDSTARPGTISALRRFQQRGIPFDYKIDHSDSASMFCSEMVYWALKSGTPRRIFQPVDVNNTKTLGFNCMLDTTNFQIVYKY
jgi:hypothetical protein